MADYSPGGDTASSGSSNNNQSSNNANNYAAFASIASSLASGIGSMFDNNETLSRSDQRWMADFQWKQSLRNEEFQREQFERNSLSGRAAEAARLGFHPLTALGINPASGGGFGTAFNTGGGSYDSGAKWRALSDMGQNLQRAASAVSTPAERASEALTLRNQSLQNDLLETQVLNAKSELMRHNRPPSRIPQPITTQTMYDSNGRPTIQPSEAFSSANSGSILGTAEWWLRNKGIPFFIGGGEHTPGYSNVPLVNGQVDNRDLNLIRKWNPSRDRSSQYKGWRVKDVERGYRNRP